MECFQKEIIYDKLEEKDFEIGDTSIFFDGIPITKPSDKKTIKIKILKDEKSRLKILDKMKTMREKYFKLETITINSQNKTACTEKDIYELKEKISQTKNENNLLRKRLQNIERERTKIDQEQKSTADYCNELKLKFKNFIKTIEQYEKTLKDINLEKDTLAFDYEQKIQYGCEKKKLLCLENSKLTRECKILNDEIVNRDIEVNILLKKKEELRELHSDKLRADKFKYDDLEIKYTRMQKILSDLESSETIKEMTEKQDVTIQKSNKNEKILVQKKLINCEKETLTLTSRLENIISKINKLKMIRSDKTVRKSHRSMKNIKVKS